jgi:L-amino acid N-acyltransferase YncA
MSAVPKSPDESPAPSRLPLQSALSQAAHLVQALYVPTPEPASEKALAVAGVNLREATLGDAPGLAAIYNASLRMHPCQPEGADLAKAAYDLTQLLRQMSDEQMPPGSSYMGPMSVKMARTWVDIHHTAQRKLWVAVRDNIPVAWLSFLGFSDRPGTNVTNEVAIYIAPQWQRKGVGRLMLEEAKRQAPGWGVDRFIAHVWHDNAPSLSLLQSVGFSLWGRMQGVVHAFGKRRDMVILGLELSTTAPSTLSQ